MILTHRLQAGGLFIDMEFDGPYDKQLWSFKDVSLEPIHAAAVVGDGTGFRTAAESAVRSLRQTPFDEYREQVSAAVQEWLLTRQDADVRQGDRSLRIYCVLKVLR